MSESLILWPIAVLFVLGFMITLRSGVVSMNGNGGMQVIAGNFSAMVLRLLGYLALLLTVQHFIGYPSSLNW